MSDVYPVKAAMELGYSVFWSDNSAWFSHTQNGRMYKSGPFKTIEDAAYAALSDHENIAAIEREQEAWDERTDTQDKTC